MSLRKVTKTRGSFPSEAVAMNLLFTSLEWVAKKRTRPVKDGKAVLNRGRIRPGMNGGLRVASWPTPPHHLSDGQNLSNSWGPPQKTGYRGAP